MGNLVGLFRTVLEIDGAGAAHAGPSTLLSISELFSPTVRGPVGIVAGVADGHNRFAARWFGRGAHRSSRWNSPLPRPKNAPPRRAEEGTLSPHRAPGAARNAGRCLHPARLGRRRRHVSPNPSRRLRRARMPMLRRRRRSRSNAPDSDSSPGPPSRRPGRERSAGTASRPGRVSEPRRGGRDPVAEIRTGRVSRTVSSARSRNEITARSMTSRSLADAARPIAGFASALRARRAYGAEAAYRRHKAGLGWHHVEAEVPPGSSSLNALFDAGCAL